MQVPLFLWFEILSFIISLVVIRKLKGTFLIYFVPFLFIIVVFELIGLYNKSVLHKSTGWLYNLLNFILIPFWMRFFSVQIINPKVKRLSNAILIGFLLFSVVNLFFIQGTRVFNNYTWIIGSAIIIVLCCYYLFEVFNLETYAAPLSMPTFWISSGAIFYFTGSFFYFALYAYLRRVQVETGTEIFNLIILNLIIILYSCIGLGLLLSKPSKK